MGIFKIHPNYPERKYSTNFKKYAIAAYYPLIIYPLLGGKNSPSYNYYHYTQGNSWEQFLKILLHVAWRITPMFCCFFW